MENLYNKASLVLTPQMVETGKVYSMKPEDRKGDFTFSRSTYATRVGPTGLIEKETQNLLTYSNGFNSWGQTGVSVTSGQSGYDGTNNAWLLTTSAVAGYINRAVVNSGVQTYSIYAKAGTETGLFIRLNGGGNPRCFFDLSTGLVGSNTNIIKPSIEDVGGGWYRCSIACNDTSTDARVYVARSGGSFPSTGSIYIQDAQLEQGLVARDYIETTTAAVEGGITDNVPRLDYTDSSCPALLLEPQRTNLVNHSEWFGDYNTFNGASITSNYSESPEGYQNATRLQLNAQSLSRIEYPVATGSAVENERHSVSCWVKSNGGDTDFRLKCTHSSVLDYYSSNLTATSEWQRFTFTQLFGAGGGATITAGILNGSSNNAADLSIYGLQLEDDGAGGGSSYATSYIPTYGSAVTRNGEGVINTNFSDIFGSSSLTQYSIFLDIKDGQDSVSTETLINKGTNTQGRINILGGDSICYFSLATSYTTGSNYTDGSPHKYLLVADNGTIKQYFDGSLISTDTNTSDEFTAFSIGGLKSMRLSQYILFPTALTDQEAIDLTTI